MAQERLRKNLKKFLLDHWLGLLLIVVLLLRIPSLSEPFTYGDEGVYLTLGQAFRRGLVLYRDIHDNKPPLLYLLAAAAGSFEIFRLLLFFWSLATILLFYKLSHFLFEKNKLAVIASTSALALLTSLRSFEGNVANAENFMMLPIIAGVFLITKGLDLSGLREAPSARRAKTRGLLPFLSAGILFSLATLFKVPAAFDFAAMIVCIFLVTKKKNYQLLITNYLALLIGFLLPILTTTVYYTFQNALSQYLTSAFFHNLPYLSSWAADQPQAAGLPLPLLSRCLAVFFLILILFAIKKKVSFITQLTLVWFGFSWLAALLSSRPYPHYLLQILPPLSLAFGLFFEKRIKVSQEKFVPGVLLITLVATFFAFQFWYYPNLPYYLNFYRFLLGAQSREKYSAYFGDQTKTIYQIANYLKTHTLSEEKIFIWGNDPYLYALAGRLPVGRYTVAYHIHDFNGYQETIEALSKAQPRYLIVTGSESRPFPELQMFVRENYFLETEINDSQIFHRTPQFL